jgi:alanine transaminase
MLQFAKAYSRELSRGAWESLNSAFSTAHTSPRESTALKFEIKRLAEGYDRRGRLMAHILNGLEGVSCQPSEGTTYLCPRVKLPPTAISAAKKEGLEGCMFYALGLWNAKNVRVTPGSLPGSACYGLERIPGTVHLRVDVLYRDEDIRNLLTEIIAFHKEFMETFTQP